MLSGKKAHFGSLAVGPGLGGKLGLFLSSFLHCPHPSEEPLHITSCPIPEQSAVNTAIILPLNDLPTHRHPALQIGPNLAPTQSEAPGGLHCWPVVTLGASRCLASQREKQCLLCSGSRLSAGKMLKSYLIRQRE